MARSLGYVNLHFLSVIPNELTLPVKLFCLTSIFNLQMKIIVILISWKWSKDHCLWKSLSPCKREHEYETLIFCLLRASFCTEHARRNALALHAQMKKTSPGPVGETLLCQLSSYAKTELGSQTPESSRSEASRILGKDLLSHNEKTGRKLTKNFGLSQCLEHMWHLKVQYYY